MTKKIKAGNPSKKDRNPVFLWHKEQTKNIFENQKNKKPEKP